MNSKRLSPLWCRTDLHIDRDRRTQHLSCISVRDPKRGGRGAFRWCAWRSFPCPACIDGTCASLGQSKSRIALFTNRTWTVAKPQPNRNRTVTKPYPTRTGTVHPSMEITVPKPYPITVPSTDKAAPQTVPKPYTQVRITPLWMGVRGVGGVA